jgi:F0F1-type ATP synthase gamma subunit
MRSYTESSEHEVCELKVIFNKLPNIWSKFETIQEVLECSDDTTDHSADKEQFENQYYYVQAKFSKLLNPVVNTPRLRHNSDSRSKHTSSAVSSNSCI